MATIKIGMKVACTHAATSWYQVNKVYDVVPHPETGKASVQGSDGLYDMLSLCSSQFHEVNKDTRVIDVVEDEK